MFVRNVIFIDLILKCYRIKLMERFVFIVCGYVVYINMKIIIVFNNLIVSIYSWYGIILFIIYRCYKVIFIDIIF